MSHTTMAHDNYHDVTHALYMSYLSCLNCFWHCRLVYGMSRDKDVRTCLREVIKITEPSRIQFVQVSALIIMYRYDTHSDCFICL